jgi:DNA mismatch repair ATPase MutS
LNKKGILPLEEKYRTIIESHQHILCKLKPISERVGNLKLLLALFIAVLVYFCYKKDFSLPIVMGTTLLTLFFLLLLVYHIRLHEKINFSEGIIQINQDHLKRINHQWTEFEDIGKEFIDKEHSYMNDLDIIGSNSFFQYLNTTNTWHGRQIFANNLIHIDFSNEEIKQRQEAILELSKNLELSNLVQYYTSKIGANPTIKTLTSEIMEQRSFFKHIIIKHITMCLPIGTILVGAASLLFQIRTLMLPASLLFLIQTFLWILGIGRLRKYLDIISNLPFKLSAYATTMEIIKNHPFSSEKLKQIQTILSASIDQLKSLGSIAEKINLKHSALLYIPFNMLLLWDYECAILLDKWKQKNANDIEQWFLALGEFESLLCFSHLPNVNAHTCLPELECAKNTITGKEIGHPLLPWKHRINNDFSCKNEIFIISGSNMSGKTTFLRTIGINLVLAQSGSLVCASNMTFPLVKVMTSMRITDDLSEGISTFYAELKRIRNIVEYAKDRSDLFFLIDEIFRGTNSVDRLSGAAAVLSKLNELNAAGMISTHDLELCNLSEHSNRVENLNFTEYYKDKKIYFDYKLRCGKSKTTNAKFLMEMAGII